MAICNLFKKFTKPTGNFMLFSLYTEDITKSMTQPGYYKVTPSKFIVMNLDYSGFEQDLNYSIPMYFQNNFENGCALRRSLKYEIDNYNHDNKHWSSNLFWHIMLEKNLLTVPQNVSDLLDFGDNEGFIKLDNIIKYIGEIDVQSYNEYDGMGYSEIYCYIPNNIENKSYLVKLETNDNENIINVPNNTKYLCGFDENDEMKFNGNWSVVNTCEQYDFKHVYKFKSLNATVDANSEQFFDFNTIVILYDVSIKNLNGEIVKLYENIPMGMYLTGLAECDDNGVVNITNAHRKYNVNEEIYGAGTSYGLRICSRFTNTPESSLVKVDDITVSDNQYPLYCNMMSSMAETQSKMDEILNKLYKKDLNYNELYSLFKNSRTNVPYIKLVNNEEHWFVNGRDVGKIEVYKNENYNFIKTLIVDSIWDLDKYCTKLDLGNYIVFVKAEDKLNFVGYMSVFYANWLDYGYNGITENKCVLTMMSYMTDLNNLEYKEYGVNTFYRISNVSDNNEILMTGWGPWIRTNMKSANEESYSKFDTYSLMYINDLNYDLNRKININKADIIKNKNNIEKNQNNIEKNQNDIETNKINIEKNKNNIETNKINIEKNKNNIETNKINIEKNKKDIAGLSQKQEIDLIEIKTLFDKFKKTTIKTIEDNINQLYINFNSINSSLNNQISNLKEEIIILKSENYKLTISATPYLIKSTKPEDVTITAKLVNTKGNIKIGINSDILSQMDSTDILTYIDKNINETKNYFIEAISDDYNISNWMDKKTCTVTAVDPIYIGAGKPGNFNSIINNSNELSVRDSSEGTYTKNVTTGKDVLYIIQPESMPQVKFTYGDGGFEYPVKEYIENINLSNGNTVSYRIYEGANILNVSEIKLNVIKK